MRHAAVVVVILCSLATIAAQDKTPLAFEVASVRTPDPNSRGSSFDVTATRIAIRNRSIEQVLLLAFETNSYQIQMPAWATSQRVTIEAVLPEGTTAGDIPAMLRTLLQERFGLVTHVEQRIIPAYDLMVGATGMKMKQVEAADELDKKDFPTGGALGGDTTENGVRTIYSVRSVRTVTNRTMWELLFAEGGRRRLDAQRMTTKELAGVLRQFVERPVIDRTGLGGIYQFTLDLPMDPMSVRILQMSNLTTDRSGQPFDFVGPSVPKTVEKIGLKLVERKDPVDVIVVDRMQQSPTPN